MGSHTFVGERLEEVKVSLQETVVDSRYTAEGYEDRGDERELGNGGTVLREHKGGTAKKHVLDDSGFWQRVRQHVSLTMPICKLLRRHDSSAPSVGKVYHGWYEVGECIDESTVPYAATAKEKYDSRWAYSHSPFLLLPMSLTLSLLITIRHPIKRLWMGLVNPLGRSGCYCRSAS